MILALSPINCRWEMNDTGDRGRSGNRWLKVVEQWRRLTTATEDRIQRIIKDNYRKKNETILAR